jgi:hypothetical protein
MVDTLNRTACPRQKSKASSRQQHESAEKGKPQNRAPSHGLDDKENFSAPSGRGRSISLDIPFYHRWSVISVKESWLNETGWPRPASVGLSGVLK